ncbi:hypothetical protein [Peribacillus phoenicis]|uniref:hypothetical protein n=1 Tax=unclassified Peribacillus TaxID=2675266 RepID=UPI0039A301DA
MKWVSFFHLTSISKFNDLLIYSERIEDFLQTNIKLIETSLDKEIIAMNLTEEEGSEYFENRYEEDYFNYKNSFPTILRRSLFLHVYSIFEQELIKLCQDIERKKPDSIKLDDLKHSGIIKAQIYLKRVAGISFPDNSNEWIKIKDYNQIRNHFAHDGRMIADKGTRLFNSIENTKGINNTFFGKHKGKEIYEIELNNEFCDEAINVIIQFLLKLDANMEKGS